MPLSGVKTVVRTIRLSLEQQRVLDMVLDGKSVFFTGPAVSLLVVRRMR
jgi:hypothetical protein